MPEMIYSAASLQDFIDCRRRFQLRYVLKVAWPAIQSEPIMESERFMQLGSRFHRLIQQHLLSIPPQRLESLIHEPELGRWWENYLGLAMQIAQSSQRYPEVSLSASLAGARFTAQCDLLQVCVDEKLVVYDWKTSRHRPTRTYLKNRLQTRLYPTLVVLSGSYLIGGKLIQPEQVEMVYWFADFPDRPQRFPYDQQQFEHDQNYLAELVSEILHLGKEDFPLSSRLESCRYCVYRSLCDRGSQAGALDEMESGDDEIHPITIDFDQVPEIGF
jgi:hypothetical protein